KEASAHKQAFENERKISDEAKAHIALLNTKTQNLTDEIAKLNAALGAAEEKAKTQNAQIADLGKRLNKALAQKASELSYYRSDFFGTLRKVLENRDDIRIVGDRFVFQSELFFKSGSASLEEKGKKQLRVLAKTVKELRRKIPAKIPWVLRVDGHTDNVPVKDAARFASNWQLSAERAIAVVRYLIEQGVPARRLVAAGFGEFQPVDTANTETARRKNRRIEFKLTER
ncbi:MAG TPA: peptidoglycan -binding protein, partial [Alphaproteobacteria bacterium]|nr:peptidoglycan -binding protein [Alphaproteobacteria bacterium]